MPPAPRVARAIDLAIGRRSSGPIFVGSDSHRLERHAAARILRQVARRGRIEKRVGPHSLRRAFITALEAGVPARDGRQAASHADSPTRPTPVTAPVEADLTGSASAHRLAAGLVHHTCKGALTQLTLSMAADLGPSIRVNAILPGAIETLALRTYFETKPPELRETILRHTRLRRLGSPEDVAATAVYLGSPAASWVTGKLLEIDGGRVDELVPISSDL